MPGSRPRAATPSRSTPAPAARWCCATSPSTAPTAVETASTTTALHRWWWRTAGWRTSPTTGSSAWPRAPDLAQLTVSDTVLRGNGAREGEGGALIARNAGSGSTDVDIDHSSGPAQPLQVRDRRRRESHHHRQRRCRQWGRFRGVRQRPDGADVHGARHGHRQQHRHRHVGWPGGGVQLHHRRQHHWTCRRRAIDLARQQHPHRQHQRRRLHRHPGGRVPIALSPSSTTPERHTREAAHTAMRPSPAPETTSDRPGPWPLLSPPYGSHRPAMRGVRSSHHPSAECV